jgi:hypothetical protein
MATGLLGGVLPYIYSRADALKRNLGDIVSNPMASTEQAVNNANDRARYLNQLHAQVASQGIKGLMSPQGRELANLYTEAYNPVGMTAKDLGYRGSHLAPNAKNYGATLDDLTKILPEDVYSQQGKQLYGFGDRLIDSEWRIAALKARGKPNAEVEIFRAVPKGVKDINSGDWVSTSKAYAKQHGESTLNGEYEIISKKVPAKTLSTEGYPYEYGYNTNFEYPQQAALDLAQQRAALPVEQGGLGLPANNTAADRAKAMGFDVPAYHGTASTDIQKFMPEGGTPEGEKTLEWYKNRQAQNEPVGYMSFRSGSFFSPKPDYAGHYAPETTGVMYPVNIRMDNPLSLLPNAQGRYSATNAPDINKTIDAMILQDSIDKSINEIAIIDPAQIRSRFAAYDPFRRDVATATAMGVALPDLLAQPVNQYPTPYETTPMYTDPFGNTIGSSIR